MARYPNARPRVLRLIQTPQAFAFSPCSKRTAAPRPKAETISPTTPRSPNGRECEVTVFDGEPGNIKMTKPEDFVARRSRAGRPNSATCVSAQALTCTLSGPAIT